MRKQTTARYRVYILQQSCKISQALNRTICMLLSVCVDSANRIQTIFLLWYVWGAPLPLRPSSVNVGRQPPHRLPARPLGSHMRTPLFVAFTSRPQLVVSRHACGYKKDGASGWTGKPYLAAIPRTNESTRATISEMVRGCVPEDADAAAIAIR
jgi:hypothetical protein